MRKKERRKKKMSFFRFSKRKVLIFIIVFYVLYFYLPVVKCIDNQDVKEKFCQKYNLCKVDIYFSLSTVISDYDSETGSFLCPASRISVFSMILLSMLFLIGSYLITCVFDYYYVRFRDK